MSSRRRISVEERALIQEQTKEKRRKYQAAHYWIRKNKIKTNICADCGDKEKTEWSNIDHKYSRNLDDYVERCRSCHKRYDIRLSKGE